MFQNVKSLLIPEKFAPQDTCTNNKDIWLYIPTAVTIIVIILVSVYVIYSICRGYRKVRRNLSPANTTPTADEKEQETSLMTTDTEPKGFYYLFMKRGLSI